MEIRQYRIFIDFTGNDDNFNGIVEIDYNRKGEPLTLDAKDMKILSLSIDGKDFPYNHDQVNWKLHIERNPPESGKLTLEYQGKISSGLRGIHWAGKGDEYMISTDFESNSARQMIPCVDHPSAKAVFSVQVKIKKDLEAISNMNQKYNIVEGETRTVVFEDTPRMSTYLLYLGIGRFTTRSLKYRNIEIILATPSRELNSTDFPLITAAKSIEFYEKTFGIEYPLPKMHLIAVPEFAGGAMENWGAITFREDSLLFNNSTDSNGKLWISTTIAHEIAHQWFGNLVTMKWWDDLWLNESFATFTSMLCIDSIYPELNVWNNYFSEEYQWALSEDCLINSHPIEAKVKEADEIEQIFDGISYGKGSAFLRMMHNYVGNENFLKGASNYLKKLSYQNAEGKQLWESIEEASEIPVVKIAEEWIKRQGFPLIKISSERDLITLEQERFLLKGNIQNEIFPVPIVIRRKNGDERILLKEKKISINAKDFVKLNADGTGFFISSYDKGYLENLDDNLPWYSDLDRADLAGNVYMLLLQGSININTYFKVITSLCNKPNSPALYIINRHLNELGNIIPEDNSLRETSSKFLHEMLDQLGEKTESEDINKTVIRNSVKENLARMDPDFAEKISGDFDDFFQKDSDERLAISIAKSHNAKDIQIFKDLLSKSNDDSDSVKIIAGMCMVKGLKNYEEIFRMIRDLEIKKQDSFSAYSYLVRNPDARKYVLDNFEESVATLQKYFSGSNYPSAFVTLAIGRLGLENKEMIERKLAKLSSPDLDFGIKKGLEYLEIYQKLRNGWPYSLNDF